MGPSIGVYIVLTVLTVVGIAVIFGPSLVSQDPRVCLRDEPDVPESIPGTAREITAAVAGSTLECAERVLIIDPTVHNVAAASRTAMNREAVLLAGSPAEVELVAGTVALLDPEVIWWPGHPNDFGGRLLPVGSPTKLETIELDPNAAVPEPDPDAEPASIAWLAPADQPEIAEMVRPVASLVGAGVGVIDIAAESWTPPFDANPDLRAGYLGSLDPSQQWLLEGLLTGRTLPDGGTSLFPDRRLIVYYGSPGIESLGVLGSIEGPEVALADMALLLDEYEELGARVSPALEIVTTIASNAAGSDDNYSTELPVDTIATWVDAAGELGAYVILDLQPGRTHFLTQAQLYEELLLEPHVGLGLDPAWRLKEDEVHLEQLGTVTAVEVNEVIAWLAELSRANNLPQKPLIIHQALPGVVLDRSSITVTPEIAVVFQSDGRGRLVDKQETYTQITSNSAPEGTFWGWKNFFDTDGTVAEPSQMLALNPESVVITYQ